MNLDIILIISIKKDNICSDFWRAKRLDRRSVGLGLPKWFLNTILPLVRSCGNNPKRYNISISKSYRFVILMFLSDLRIIVSFILFSREIGKSPLTFLSALALLDKISTKDFSYYKAQLAFASHIEMKPMSGKMSLLNPLLLRSIRWYVLFYLLYLNCFRYIFNCSICLCLGSITSA